MVKKSSLFIGASIAALAAWYYATNKQGIKPMKKIVFEMAKVLNSKEHQRG